MLYLPIFKHKIESFSNPLRSGSILLSGSHTFSLTATANPLTAVMLFSKRNDYRALSQVSPFQILSLGFILNTKTLKFRKFQPQYSYKISTITLLSIIYRRNIKLTGTLRHV